MTNPLDYTAQSVDSGVTIEMTVTADQCGYSFSFQGGTFKGILPRSETFPGSGNLVRPDEEVNNLDATARRHLHSLMADYEEKKGIFAAPEEEGEEA